MMMMMKSSLLLVAACFLACSLALNNGLGRTPPLGWNSWNHFHCSINEELIKQTADAIVSSGFKDVGYSYVNLDDCWQLTRDSEGMIHEDAKAFPSGIKALADYIHSKGLKFGLYSDAGYKTCAGRPGSLGYEKNDARTYAMWTVDYLKYDNCNTDDSKPEVRYPVMRDALNATGRPIFYSMCEWGVDNPASWAPEVGNSWRTTGDISDNWKSMLSNLDHNGDAKYAGPGGFNDPDMLEVGNGGMTNAEYISHFSLWALVKSPLLIGCDVTKMSNETLNILTNREVISLNQDPLGIQGKRVAEKNGVEVWSGELSGKSYGVILFNRNAGNETIAAQWTDLGLTPTARYTLRDLWAHKDIGVFAGNYSTLVESHSVKVYKFTPAA